MYKGQKKIKSVVTFFRKRIKDAELSVVAYDKRNTLKFKLNLWGMNLGEFEMAMDEYTIGYNKETGIFKKSQGRDILQLLSKDIHI